MNSHRARRYHRFQLGRTPQGKPADECEHCGQYELLERGSIRLE